MSVVYEPRSFIHDGGYPPMDEAHDGISDPAQFSEINDAMPESNFAELANATSSDMLDVMRESSPHPELDSPSLPKHHSPAPTPVSVSTTTPTIGNGTVHRIKSIPKPEREPTKNAEGKYVCQEDGCTDTVKAWSRKCEWNKHMDKHQRPYKCLAEGCEKLAGFTYSGGLLRHEREVHGKHGGPKNSFNCPYPNCKRNTGKGFSRQENLQEHLRRVHTQNGANGVNGTSTAAEETDGFASDTSGQKRKRDPADSELRDENKKIKLENEELKQQVEAQNQQTVVLINELSQLRSQLATLRSQVSSAPTAPML